MSWKRSAWRIGMVLLFVVAAWKIYTIIQPQMKNLEWHDFTMWQPSAAPLAVSVLLIVIANITHAILWRRIAIDLGSPAPNARATLHIYFVSSISRYVVKLGQMAGLAVLAGRFGMAAGRATAAALLGQLIFMSTGFLFISAVIPGVRRYFPRLPFDPAWIGAGLAIATVAGVWIMVGTPIGHRVRHALLRRVQGRLAERLESAFRMVDEARPRDAAIWVLGYTASWVILAVAFAVFVTAFYPPGAHEMRFVGGVAVASYLLAYFSPTPAGIGLREGIMVLLLQLTGMPIAAATVIAILSRVWFMAGELLPLLLIPFSGKSLVSSPAAGVIL